ncbi:TPA: hypothetical protein N0F65_011245, partial [Lagenidium giganteum]
GNHALPPIDAHFNFGRNSILNRRPRSRKQLPTMSLLYVRHATAQAHRRVAATFQPTLYRRTGCQTFFSTSSTDTSNSNSSSGYNAAAAARTLKLLERRKVTTLDIGILKRKKKPITMVTAYDYPSAVHVDLAGFDILLVGDSVGMVELGMDTTIPVTMEDIIHHTRAVKRGAERPLIVGDMPFGSCEGDPFEALKNAQRLLKEGGADCVKIEGGVDRAKTIHTIVQGGIAVMGHIGLRPQHISVLGGFRAQGRTVGQAEAIIEDALAVQEAGAFAVVLECVPSIVAKHVTDILKIPTIGIGAGPHTSGQVLVFHDLLGMLQHPHHAQHVPKFCKRYADVGERIRTGLEEYRDDVEAGRFPDEKYAPYKMSPEESEKLRQLVGTKYKAKESEDAGEVHFEYSKSIEPNRWQLKQPGNISKTMTRSTTRNQIIEDDEPPMLDVSTPALLGLANDNQRDHEQDDSSIMQEMMKVAEKAKAEKRQQQAKERNSKTFGSGLKKGFFASKKSASKSEPKRSAEAKTPAKSKLLIVDSAAPVSTVSAAPLFPEVQAALTAANQSALKNPRFTEAINDLQRDPTAAMHKYRNDAAVTTMLRDFTQFLGNHFEELGKLQGGNEQTKKQPPAPPAKKIVDLDEARREAIANMARSPDEEAQVQQILKNPELLAALSDAQLMERLRAAEKAPAEFQRLLSDPNFGPKLRLLISSGMARMAHMKDQVDAEMARYRTLQEEVQVLATQRQQFAQQANENTMVKKELDLLDDDAKVYKLIGPVLLKQDVGEAKTNVNKRLEFINNELEKVNTKIEQKEKDAVEIRKGIAQLQMEMQKNAAEAARSAVAAK